MTIRSIPNDQYPDRALCSASSARHARRTVFSACSAEDFRVHAGGHRWLLRQHRAAAGTGLCHHDRGSVGGALRSFWASGRGSSLWCWFRSYSAPLSPCTARPASSSATPMAAGNIQRSGRWRSLRRRCSATARSPCFRCPPQLNRPLTRTDRFKRLER